LGITLDGLGYGDDGTLWGGEFLLADYRESTRLAAFDAVALPGGDAANREPWRNAYAHLQHALGWELIAGEFAALPAIQRLQEKPLATLATMMERGVNAPPSSSCGRLFDAAAALLEICFDAMSYEGQAAMQLEQLATREFSSEGPYPHAVQGVGPLRIRWAPLWRALLDDLAAGVERGVIAARFHQGVVHAVVEQARALMTQHRFDTVALSGGVMQNRLIAEGLVEGLEGLGLRVLLPATLPTNDGGIALGQALVAAARQT
jgi:hydrogenase maturation protein HypF